MSRHCHAITAVRNSSRIVIFFFFKSPSMKKQLKHTVLFLSHKNALSYIYLHIFFIFFFQTEASIAESIIFNVCFSFSRTFFSGIC